MEDRYYMEDYNLSGELNKCPSCQKNIHPTYVDHRRIDNRLVVLYTCPSCKEIITCRYSSGIPTMNRVIYWSIDDVYPMDLEKVEFSNIIKEISSEFCDIYNQAKQAENIGLRDICGVGYRKALEFLVKDYAIYKNPDDEEKIGKRPLKQCIDNYINYENVKKCATAATFLGNDETHYIRKFEDKDVSDLKRLIKMTVSWIDLVEQTERDLLEMGI